MAGYGEEGLSLPVGAPAQQTQPQWLFLCCPRNTSCAAACFLPSSESTCQTTLPNPEEPAPGSVQSRSHFCAASGVTTSRSSEAFLVRDDADPSCCCSCECGGRGRPAPRASLDSSSNVTAVLNCLPFSSVPLSILGVAFPPPPHSLFHFVTVWWKQSKQTPCFSAFRKGLCGFGSFRPLCSPQA